MWKVSLARSRCRLPRKQVITQDNVSIGVAAVAYFRRVDAVKSIVEIEDIRQAVAQIAQTTVRNVVGRSLLDQVLTDTQTLNLAIREILDRITQQWARFVFPGGAEGHHPAGEHAARDGPPGGGGNGRSARRSSRPRERR